MKFFQLFFLLFYLSNSFSQSPEIDSLKQLLSNPPTEDMAEQLELMYAFGKALMESSADSAILVGKEGLVLAENHQLTEKEIFFHRLLSTCYSRKGMFHESIGHLEKLIDLYRATGKEDDMIRTYIDIGSSYTRLDPEQSMPFFNKALVALEDNNKPQLLGALHQSMGISFYYNKNLNQAGIHIEKAIEAYQQTNNWQNLCSNNNILGLIRQGEEKLDQAENHFSIALDLAEKHQFHYSKIGILSNLGRFYAAAKGQSERGATYMKFAYEAALQAGYVHRAANILLSLSGAYEQMGDEQNAILAIKESLALQEDMDDVEMQMTALGQIHSLYSKEKDYKNAYKYFTQFKTLQDSLLNEKNLHNIEELEKKYKTQEQQSQIQLQETQLQQQNTRLLAISLIALLLLSLVFFIWRNDQAKKRINSQLRQLDQSKSRFFANISHELRTPLTLILAPLENALQKSRSNSVKEDLGIAQNNGKKLLTLVNEILDLSKLESGKMQLKENTVMLRPLLSRILFSYQSFAQLQELSLSYSYQLPENLAVKLDIGKFEKVINNLLSNAFKYSKPGGVVTLRATEPDAGMLKIEVKDTGKGIRAKELDRIFERFYQADDENVPLQGGTGIGLAYARELARLFGGDLRVQSEWGKGSNFIFTLPQKKAPHFIEVAENMEIPLKHSAGSFPYEDSKYALLYPERPRILIVEDNLEMSRFLLKLLSVQFNCSTAKNGLEALEKLDRESFDLITSDVMMPQMDGFTLLQKIQRREALHHTPVLLLTARALEEDKLKGFALGVDDYLTKPFNSKELIARINNLLKNKLAREQWRKTQTPPEGTAPAEEESLTAEQQLLQRAKELVLLNLENPVYKIGDLARDLNYSQRQLQRIIKKLTGFSPVEFVKELRLQRAYHMLETRQFATVAEVHYALGMESASYFSKAFRERFGKNPGEVIAV